MKKYLVKKTEKWGNGFVDVDIMNRSFWSPENWDERTEEEKTSFASRHGWDSLDDPDIVAILNGEYNNPFADMYEITVSFEILCFEV